MNDNGNASLYGYPPRAKDCPDPGYLYLSDPTNADLRYILGLSWRRQIVLPSASPEAGNTKENGCSRLNEYSYIPIPRDDLNEAQHCLRMKRCGAQFIISEGWPLLESKMEEKQYNQRATMQIFGWPDSGGVWIYRIPRIYLGLSDDDPPRDIGGDLEAGLKALETREAEGIDEKMSYLKMNIEAQDNMDGVCDILRDTGGEFYKSLEDCPEVVDLGLLTPDISRNDWLPPPHLMDRWQRKES
ncbi:MAG: hypothetical protein OHK93_007239 [Ramalina farinacea]|uniref:Uncharacterized protein n=1 Tax=Ramalina farinacea TaxID=258253 RepID=A0AA43TVC3_9LECA|nr:hypothetical protein [Ramalina farinacea]